MTPYTTVSKPLSTSYTAVNDAVGKEEFDDPLHIFDDPTVFYDGVNQSQYTNLAKPVTSYTNIAKPV